MSLGSAVNLTRSRNTAPELPDSRLGNTFLRGVAAMVVRQVLGNAAMYATTLILAWWLSPTRFGAFAVATSFLGLVTLLGELGLGAALVQRDRGPQPTDLGALFGLHLLLFGGLAAAAFILAPHLVRFYGLPPNEVVPFRALALTCWLPALRSVPTALLERRLAFHRLAVIETAGVLAYQGILILAVARGAGLWSLAAASTTRGLIEALLAVHYQPWWPTKPSSWATFAGLLPVGLGLHGIRVLALAKDSLGPLVVSPLLGLADVGVLQWAILYAGAPVYFTNLVVRVAFPAFARAQGRPDELASLLRMALRLNFAVGLPASLALTIWAPDVIDALFGPAWYRAAPIARALFPNMVAGLALGVLFALLTGIGALGASLRLVLGWVVATYAIALAAIGWGLGVLGVASAYSLATLGALAATVCVTHRIVGVLPLNGLGAALLPTLPVAVVAGLDRIHPMPVWLGLPLALGLSGTVLVAQQRATLRALLALPLRSPTDAP
jgi:O-antigen/teichoic acid export membrane protein